MMMVVSSSDLMVLAGESDVFDKISSSSPVYLVLH